MARKTVLEDPTPLQLNYLPETVIDREEEQAALKTVFSDATSSSRNLHLHGTSGTGKTHLTLLAVDELESVNVCYIPCTVYDTQYKALMQIYQAVSGENIGTGHHTSDLQRLIEKRVSAVDTVIILDEIEFLLLNDGDDLLYYLSRLNENVSVHVISSHYTDLKPKIEERTYSTLQPERVSFEPYTAEETYRILIERARNALKPQSLQREALTYIASTTSNIQIALTWLRYAAEQTENAITESLVHDTQEPAYMDYVNHLLKDFTEHHYLLYEAIHQLSEDSPEIQTGEIYSHYKQLCEATDHEPLSDRRISDYLKHLELLDLIQADYHYGGKQGKTRDVRMNSGL